MNFAIKLQHKALVDIFSFLIRKFQSSEDYGISDPRKLDMRGGGRLDPPFGIRRVNPFRAINKHLMN